MKDDCIFLDKERKLCFSVMAMEDISKKFGSMDKAFDKTKLEKNPTEAVDTICEMVIILINAAIMRRNKLIELGLETGEKEPVFDMPKDVIKTLWKLNDFKRCKVAIVSSMATGYETDYEEEEEE